MESRKKILVIMGSPHTGNTFRACEEIRELLQREMAVDFEYLWLKDANLQPCKGCFSCFSRGEETCPCRDDVQAIEQKMRDADGVIFASPVYGMNVSGLMKNFIDRFCYIFHRPRFFDKKALLLTTTGALGHDDVLKYLDTVARVWGFGIAGTVGLITPPGGVSRRQAGANRRELVNAARVFSAALLRNSRPSPGLKDVIIFHGQRAAFSQLVKDSPADYRYWKEKGWLDRRATYYVDVPVNPLYHTIGMVAGWIVAGQIRRDIQDTPGGVP